MKLETFEREECLRQAVEITRAYAQSGENKHGPVTDFLDSIYTKLLEIRESITKESENENGGKS